MAKYSNQIYYTIVGNINANTENSLFKKRKRANKCLSILNKMGLEVHNESRD